MTSGAGANGFASVILFGTLLDANHQFDGRVKQLNDIFTGRSDDHLDSPIGKAFIEDSL